MTNNIENIILERYQNKMKRSVGQSELNSWKNSLMYMNNLLYDAEIPNDAGITIEYSIPQTSKRIDFIITGKNEQGVENVILIELKQWSEAKISPKDGLVITRFQHGEAETSHPSYQAWSYAALLESFNETIYQEGIGLKPCAYLHNYDEDGVINNDFYNEHIQKAPIFLKNDALKLREFIKKHVKYGDDKNLMYRINEGKIRPSKHLADNLEKMILGNKEFVMIDEQKVVYESAIFLAKQSLQTNRKNVLIVSGGPGTGKSVVAINLLVDLIKLEMVTKYVTKNSAPRTVYETRLTNSFKKTYISNLFSGSGAFTDTPKNTFDALIVDEAHRLNEKSGMFSNIGENQIKEIINSAKFSIFFVDEDQKVTFKDIGDREEIANWAEKLGAQTHYLELSSQFRCNGSDGYLAWLDNALQIRETANPTLEGIDYDFRVVSSPNEFRDLIYEKNKINNRARMVAGYCWNWVSKNNANQYDINFPDFDFQAKWNLTKDGMLWIVSPESVNEVGCIHTCQGLELDYVGVIIGDDLIVRNGQVLVDPSKRARTDSSLNGFKNMYKNDPQAAMNKARAIIKNTYRTLMTRGMKGCYVYFTDKETEEWFRRMLI